MAKYTASPVFADSEDLDDVRVAEAGCGRGFAPEPLLELLIARILRLEHLERDRDLELGVDTLCRPTQSRPCRRSRRSGTCPACVLGTVRARAGRPGAGRVWRRARESGLGGAGGGEGRRPRRHAPISHENASRDILYSGRQVQ